MSFRDAVGQVNPQPCGIDSPTLRQNIMAVWRALMAGADNEPYVGTAIARWEPGSPDTVAVNHEKLGDVVVVIGDIPFQDPNVQIGDEVEFVPTATGYKTYGHARYNDAPLGTLRNHTLSTGAIKPGWLVANGVNNVVENGGSGFDYTDPDFPLLGMHASVAGDPVASSLLWSDVHGHSILFIDPNDGRHVHDGTTVSGSTGNTTPGNGGATAPGNGGATAPGAGQLVSTGITVDPHPDHVHVWNSASYATVSTAGSDALLPNISNGPSGTEYVAIQVKASDTLGDALSFTHTVNETSHQHTGASHQHSGASHQHTGAQHLHSVSLTAAFDITEGIHTHTVIDATQSNIIVNGHPARKTVIPIERVYGPLAP